MENHSPKHSYSLLYTIIFLIIGVVVGGAVAVQIITTRTIARSTDPVRPALELTDTVEKMKAEQQNLRQQIADLRERVKDQEKSVEERRTTSKELSAELQQYKMIAGLTEVTGTGVEITLNDGFFEGLPDRNDFKNDAIVHSTDILDVVNMLWAAGAEAVAINDERVVGTTSINCIVNTILVNDSHLGMPLTIKAIGRSEDLARLIEDPGRLIDLHRRQNDYRLVLEVAKRDSITIDPFLGTYGN
jgi:uncharacterized protein YlxW (UPF0749 family)